MADITYTVNEETFAVEVFSSDTPDAPFLFQPDWPNCEPWASAEEATEWAEEFVSYYTKQTNVPPRAHREDAPEPEVANDPEAAPVEEALAEESVGE